MGRLRNYRSNQPDYRRLIGEALLEWHSTWIGPPVPQPDGPELTVLSERQRLLSPREATAYEALNNLEAYYRQIEDALEPCEFSDSVRLPSLARAASQLRNRLWKRVQRVLVLGRTVYIFDALELQVRNALKKNPRHAPITEDAEPDPIVIKVPYNYDPTFLGRRLCHAISAAQKAISELRSMKDPFALVLADSCQVCYQLILAALKDNMILGVCQHKRCGNPFFPTKPSKKHCSVEYEGRNCQTNAKTMRHDQRKRKSSGKKTAGE